jgi:hypothetical protein
LSFIDRLNDNDSPIRMIDRPIRMIDRPIRLIDRGCGPDLGQIHAGVGMQGEHDSSTAPGVDDADHAQPGQVAEATADGRDADPALLREEFIARDAPAFAPAEFVQQDPGQVQPRTLQSGVIEDRPFPFSATVAEELVGGRSRRL